jgi:hypothetical protein
VAFWSRVKRRKLNAGEVARILEDFLEGTGGPWDWDDFTSGMSLDDPELEEIRNRCTGLWAEFPSDNPRHYCSEQGRKVIRDYIRQLRASSGSPTKSSQ